MTRVRRALASLAGRGVRVRVGANSAGRFRRALRRLGCLNLRSSRGAASPLREFGAASTPVSRETLGHASRWEIRPATGTSWCSAGPARGVASTSRSRRAAEDESASQTSRVAESSASHLESSSFPETRFPETPASTADISGRDPSLRHHAPADCASRSPVVHQLAAAAGRDRQAQPAARARHGRQRATRRRNNARRPKLDAVTSGRGGNPAFPSKTGEDGRVRVRPGGAARRPARRTPGRAASPTPSWTSRERADPRKCADRETRRAARWAQERAVRAARRRRRRRARARRADARAAGGAERRARRSRAPGRRRRRAATSLRCSAAGPRPGDPARVQRPGAADAAQERPRDHGQARLRGAPAAALRRLKVADLRRACGVLGVPSARQAPGRDAQGTSTRPNGCSRASS